MTVKELIEILKKCNPELPVTGDYGELTRVIEHNEYSNPDASSVEII